MSASKKQPRLAKNGRIGSLTLQNIRSARHNWLVSATQTAALKALTKETELSVAAGDLSLIDGKWYVTHSGLLRIAQRDRCVGINTLLLEKLSNPERDRWVFRATVYKRSSARGFVGYGDADPSNTSPLVRGAEMRVAETRAVNRALRKAYGVGLCSVEELGWAPKITEPGQTNQAKPFNVSGNGQNGQPRLRDQLCLLIRQYNLDPTLVKAYADSGQYGFTHQKAHMIQSRKSDVDGQHHPQHELVHGHRSRNSPDPQRGFHQRLKAQLLQHRRHRQQTTVGSQILAFEVVGRGSPDFIKRRKDCWRGLWNVLSLIILIAADHHLGDSWKSAREAATLRPLCFTTGFPGSLSGSLLQQLPVTPEICA
jgi:hypothetical protein